MHPTSLAEYSNCGGWTEIIHDSNTTLLYLSNFGDTNNITDTFYSNSTYGIGWGTNDSIQRNLKINFNYSNILITYSGFYNVPVSGLGILSIVGLLVLNDSWTNNLEGQSLSIKGINQFIQSQINITDRTDNIQSINSSNLDIKMWGISSYPYTKRYIKKLKLR